MKEKTKRLKEILTSGKKLLIFSHNNPDPDSIASSVILSEIAKQFKLKTKIVFHGEIGFSKNIAMISSLKLNLEVYKPNIEKKYDLTAIVDSQKGMSNNQFPQDFLPDLTFDHHPHIIKLGKQGKQKNFYDIRTESGTAASILLDYYFDLGLKMTEKIATVFCFAIISETNHFTRKYNNIDVSFYKRTIQYANLKKISEIENTKNPALYFEILNRALSNYQKKDKIISCSLGEIKNIEFLHEIADLLLTMEDVDFVILTGKAGEINKVCCRSISSSIHLGSVLKASLQGIGSGGGHETMAAGDFSVHEDEVISRFVGVLKDFSKKHDA